MVTGGVFFGLRFKNDEEKTTDIKENTTWEETSKSYDEMFYYNIEEMISKANDDITNAKTANKNKQYYEIENEKLLIKYDYGDVAVARLNDDVIKVVVNDVIVLQNYKEYKMEIVTYLINKNDNLFMNMMLRVI